MTPREKFIKCLKREPITGHVPHFELVFFLTMEAIGKVHPQHRSFDQWDQMSRREQDLHIKDIAQTYIATAEKYNLRLTVVTLDDSNEYETHKNLYEYIYSKYKKYKIIDKDNFSINKEFFKDELYLKDDFSYLLKKDELDKIKTIVKITKMRGYRNNSQVGVIDIYLENKKIGEVKIYVKKNS